MVCVLFSRWIILNGHTWWFFFRSTLFYYLHFCRCHSKTFTLKLLCYFHLKNKYNMYTSRYHYRLQNIITQLQYPKSKILNNFIHNVTSVLSIINVIDCSGVKKKTLFSETLRIAWLSQSTFLSEHIVLIEICIFFLFLLFT